MQPKLRANRELAQTAQIGASRFSRPAKSTASISYPKTLFATRLIPSSLGDRVSDRMWRGALCYGDTAVHTQICLSPISFHHKAVIRAFVAIILGTHVLFDQFRGFKRVEMIVYLSTLCYDTFIELGLWIS